MTDSASIVPISDCVLDFERLIAEWAAENPEATEYCLGDEIEAQSLLLVIAAHLKHAIATAPNHEARTLLKSYARDMRRATIQNKAMDYIRELNETDQLTFLGLDIVTPDKETQH